MCVTPGIQLATSALPCYIAYNFSPKQVVTVKSNHGIFLEPSSL